MHDSRKAKHPALLRLAFKMASRKQMVLDITRLWEQS